MTRIARFDPIFTDHMVIQRCKNFQVWGTGTDGVKLTVTCRNESASTEVNGGIWRVTFPAMDVGKPCELTLAAEESLFTLVDVVFGDVWLAGGQSNMEWPLNKSEDAVAAIAAADLPDLRYYDVPKVAYEIEGIHYKSKWKTCTPADAGDFSAVAYYFARELIASEQVPIGIIGCNWGGTSASCWVEEEILHADPELSIYTREFTEQLRDFDWEVFKGVNKAYYDSVARYNQNESAGVTGEELGSYPWPPPISPHSFMRPGGLYETMLRKVFAYSIKGIIYYQGESDAHHPETYSRLLETLILDWRKQWQDAELPFLFVQLPIYACNDNPNGDEWPLIREAQQQTADRVPFAEMAVLLECGDAGDIHPLKKKPVGERLALLALDKIYGRPVQSSGPVYSKLSLEEGKAVIYYAYADNGLKIREGMRLAGFEVAAADGIFKAAAAEIQGNTVWVSSLEVASPQYVRYGWANVTDANLISANGLPAAPFRSK